MAQSLGLFINHASQYPQLARMASFRLNVCRDHSNPIIYAR